MDYQDRHRAEGFGALADQYERTRPTYPIELIQWLSLGGRGAAVDFGCGTGRVSLLLGKAGWDAIGIEPDPRMAEVARSRGAKVVVTTFENWDCPHIGFDLVAAGTSWHWVDPKVGFDKAASVLRPGGTLAIFRNSYHYEPLLSEIIETGLQFHAPHLLHSCVPLGTLLPIWSGLIWMISKIVATCSKAPISAFSNPNAWCPWRNGFRSSRPIHPS